MGDNDLWDPFARYKKRKGPDDLFPSLFDFRPGQRPKKKKGDLKGSAKKARAK